MSKRDYEALARIIFRNVGDESLRACLALDMADYFKATYPGFDERRWFAACRGQNA